MTGVVVLRQQLHRPQKRSGHYKLQSIGPCGLFFSKPVLGSKSLGARSRVGLAQNAQLALRPSVKAQLFPFDQAWGPSLNASSLAPQLFAMSLFPYLCFLFYLQKCGKTPRLTLFGFYFLLVFVAATIPAGIYAKTHYGTALANVDWLHGGAESLLTVTNLMVVLGLRQGIREAEAANKAEAAAEAAEAQQQQEQDGQQQGSSRQEPSVTAGGKTEKVVR